MVVTMMTDIPSTLLNKYECQTGPLEGFFVSSVEFCKHVKFDDNKRDIKTGPQGPAGPAGSGNNNSTLVNSFNCINTNNININTESNQSSSSSSSSGLQPIQDAIAQGLNGTLDGLSLNKTIVNLCVIIDNDSIVIEGAGNVTDGNGNLPETCEECFRAFLTEDQISDFVGSATLEGYCDAIESGSLDENEVRLDLANVASMATIDDIIECLQNLGILPI